ncbi:uncharacterized protein SCHCODRAFT_02622883 [Schizophyllum commune H4-8]|uniref:uncharacterized protein n=1 Tax=Schizophyllum commune (strain H4-8 / FGSC 9210) TaxID=578458 RepID=UPI00215E2C9F|nr:uncharacterized protein SCHCODRAFT_02622883 [Schizophyllum commune H4-8]KAI5893836.1 hypothetical protein SCHCODRAFT_02622883 [Schizophyllum commune H4-8]
MPTILPAPLASPLLLYYPSLLPLFIVPFICIFALSSPSHWASLILTSGPINVSSGYRARVS